MQKKYPKTNLKKKKNPELPPPKTINRSWGQAPRFEQCHIKRIKSK